MTWWQALILGIVQGASEFLPISSSGHLLLLEKAGIGQTSLLFNITAHVGTLIAVLIAMFKSWAPLVRHPLQKKTGYLFLACLPTLLIAAIIKMFAPTLLDGAILGFGFMLTACLLFASEKLCFAQKTSLNVKNSILSGVLQGIAVLPGVSRSGATISALRLAGVDKSEAADFSFLMSIPIIAGSALMEGIEIARDPSLIDVSASALIIGAVAAFATGLAAVFLFLKLIKKHTTLPFAAYTFALGIIITAWQIYKVCA